MPQFQFYQPFFNPREIRESARSKAYLRPQAGPRLVGGTTFEKRLDLKDAHVEALAQACLTGLEAARKVIFGWQRQGLSLAQIYLGGFAPCARLLGEWWYADHIDFALTTIASTHLQRLLHEFSAEFVSEEPSEPNNLSLLILTEPGAQHNLGLFMLGQFFRRAGWSVTLGVPPDVAALERMFHAEWFDAIGVSVSTDRHLATLENLLPELKAMSVNPNMHIFVGGPMALLDPERLNWHFAELIAEDAPGTVRRVSESLARQAL